MLEGVLKLICIGSGAYAKWNAYVFLRLLPSGPIYLPIIYTSTIIYIVSFLILRTISTSTKFASQTSSKFLNTPLILLGGVYNRYYPNLSWIGAFITLLAPILSVDFVYRTHVFYPQNGLELSRAGWVSHDTANLLLRLPETGNYNLTYWPTNGQSQENVLVLSGTNASTDHTIPIRLDNLIPDTEYHYEISPDIKGSFTTRRRSEELDKFTILSTSCLKPGWPYNPFYHPLEVKGFTHLDNTVRKMERRPEAMLFLGDFIYSDLPAPVSEYTTTYYRQLYRQVYSSPSLTPLLKSIPWIHMFDDHEIVNDFSPSSSPDNINMFENAMEPYISYQRSVNPPPINPLQPTYFSYEVGKVSFFILDNRSYRSSTPIRPGKNSEAGHGERSMLGEQQLQAVKEWIDKQGREGGKLLVLVSGVPVTRNWSEGKDELDSWAGYLDEREIILEDFWSVGGAIIISGDRHEHATTLLPPPFNSQYPSSSAVIEFSTSPLSFFHLPWAREYVPHLPTDIPIHHQYKGDSRFGIFDFDTSEEQPKVHFKLVVDGEEEWEYTWVKGREVIVPIDWASSK